MCIYIRILRLHCLIVMRQLEDGAWRADRMCMRVRPKAVGEAYGLQSQTPERRSSTYRRQLGRSLSLLRGN